jgi:nucleotide-binding universal stress UspA family protein
MPKPVSSDLWLVAHDLGPCGEAAAQAAARIAAGIGARLHILNIHPVELRAPYERTGEETFSVEQEKRASLRACAERLKGDHPSLNVAVEVIAGTPTKRILEEAERLGATQIVVGTHGRRGMTHLVLGSVAEAVVHESLVPVLVVKVPKT